MDVWNRFRNMPPAFVLLTLLLSSASAINPIVRLSNAVASTTSSEPPTASPSRQVEEPLCFTPPDLHSVSHVADVCATLMDEFVTSFGTRMNDRLRWTGNNSEVGRDMVHLPQVATRRNLDQTGACLIEVVDRGKGDWYSAASIKAPGMLILKECFAEEKCGEVALPPHGTTTLAICGTYRPNGTSLLRRPVSPMSDSDVAARGLTLG